MASLDVESLFTNIFLNVVIDIYINDTSMIHNFNCTDMREILTLAVYQLFFIFDQVVYRHTDGVAMGFALGPNLANAFLCHFEK